MSTGYNWRKTLIDFAHISGVLAGFCVAFIGIVLGWEVANTPIYGNITFGHFSILLFGVSTGLFIASSEFFLHAKEFDMFDLSKEYEEWIEEYFKKEKKDWNKHKESSHVICRQNEKYGRKCYNAAIILIFVGLFFVVFPYNVLIAFIVSGLGILLESLQFVN